MSQSNTKRITSRSAKETQALGKRIGRLLIEGDVLLLNGTLGAGKTALAQGIGRGLGVETQVNSPTFVLMARHPGEVPLYHADLYRLTEVDEVEDLDLVSQSEDGVLVIEWPERGLELMPEYSVTIQLDSGTDEDTREISITGDGDIYERIVTGLE